MYAMPIATSRMTEPNIMPPAHERMGVLLPASGQHRHRLRVCQCSSIYPKRKCPPKRALPNPNREDRKTPSPDSARNQGQTNYSAAAASALASASVPHLPESFPDRHNQSDSACLPVAVPAPARDAASPSPPSSPQEKQYRRRASSSFQ